MALTNIFNEPRREIIEQIAGVLILVVPVWLDYRFAVWFQHVTGPRDPCPVPMGMFFGAVAGMMIISALIMIHWAGEAVCDALAERGLELRPTQRYRR